MRSRSGAVAAGAALAAVAYPRAIELALRHNLRRLRAGDPGPMTRFYPDDVRFRFPGENSWAGELTSKAQLSDWLDRFVAIGLQLHADEILIAGPPWRTRFCIRCHDHLRDETGAVVYENRAAIVGTMRWGRVREYEVYEDTERTAALDRWLAARERQVADSTPVATSSSTSVPTTTR